MADRRHEIGFELIEEAESSHVAKHHCGPQGVSAPIADGPHLGQVGPVLAAEPEGDRLVETIGCE